MPYRTVACAVLLLVLNAVQAVDYASPLLVRNTAPAALLFGMPTLRGDTGELYFSIDHGNIFTGRNRDGVEVIFDGETTVAAVSWNQDFAGVWSWGVEVPWVRHTGGTLDSLIDGFHETFGLRDAGRDSVERDRLLYWIRTDGNTRLLITDSEQHVGDVRLFLGRTLFADEARTLSVRGLVKLPTGDADRLTGSGALDSGMWLEYGQTGLFGLPRLSMSAMAGGIFLGEGELLAEVQRDFMPAGHFGLGYQVSDRVQFLMQADAHGAAFDIDASILSRAGLQGTLGGRLRLRERLWLDVGLVEDLYSSSSPDVIFHVSLNGHLGAP